MPNIYVLLTLTIISLSTGWEIRSWYDTSKEVNVITKQEENVAKGESSIINQTQKIEKVYVKVHDDCLDKPMPKSVQLLISGD